MNLSRKKIVVVVGPNASGKSDYGIKLAKKLNGEIISADSRQVYRGLNIGSGKVPGKWIASRIQRLPAKIKRGSRGSNNLFVYKKIVHHCIDIANPKKIFSAEDFKNCAQKAIDDIFSRGKIPVIVGGTGFYIDAALGRMKLGGVPPNSELRKKISGYSADKLLNMLKKLDPARAETVEQKNPVRLIRAIEIAKAKRSKGESNGSPNGFFSAFGTVPERSGRQKYARSSKPLAGAARMSEKGALLYPKIKWIGIKRSPEELKKRIQKRLIVRLPGIIREVKKLRESRVSWKRLFELGLEYRYTSLYLRGKLNKKEFVNQLEAAIWQYARRQMTWFKKNREIKWISLK